MPVFSDTFDGGGHTVSNRTIALPTAEFTGFFARAYDAEINHITLTEASVVGKAGTFYGIGGLIGRADNSTATNGPIPESGVSTSSYNCGGLIDFASATIIYDSNAQIPVLGTGAGNCYGGLAGYATNLSRINCFATGNVSGGATGEAVSGLVGAIDSGATDIIHYLNL